MPEPWFFEALPYRPAPYPDECLSSYLLRLAEANGFAQFWDLAIDLFPFWTYPGQVAGLRWEYPVKDERRLVQRTQLSVSALHALTLAPLVEKFRPLLDRTRSRYGSPGLALHRVAQPNWQVCPSCLQAEPYLRLIWRLVGVSACLEHGCLLQTRCPGCGNALSITGLAQHHLRCAACGTDWRTVPVAPAPAALLAAQQPRQTGLRYLLDPERRLAPALPPGSPELPAAVGLKFRYLRLEDKRSVAQMARHMGTEEGRLAQLERGAGAPLALYPVYLEHFKLSWSEFAGLHVPAEFVETLATPRHLPLRLCPTAGCPNHGPQPTLRVTLLRDLPEEQIARFRCLACGRRFTRGYDGTLRTKPRQPVIQPGDPPSVPKSPREIARLKRLGLQGEPNRQIARALGWGEQTVHMYWIALGLEERVHRAQAHRRGREQRQRQAERRSQLETALRTLRQQGNEITLAGVGRAAGHGPQYFNGYPALAQRVKAVAGPHNRRLRQQRYAAIRASLTEAIAQMQQSHTLVKVEMLVRPTGLSYDGLRRAYPELYAVARAAARAHRVAWRAARRQSRREAINAAAARLVARGSRLTYGTILKEARLSRYTAQCDPTLRELLQQWAGGFAPHD